jgi:thiol-disulfide isomerase/thioredoxin
MYLNENYRAAKFDYLINNYVLDGGCANEQVAYQWKEKVTSYERLLVGKTAPDIQFDNSKSLTQVVQNSTYSLLFFWSSQCHFCHDQFPELKALYDKYGGELEIIGLSLDTDNEQWQATINQNQLRWLNYSELKGWDTSSAKTFKINRTPSYYLLDKESTIIAKPKNASELIEIIKSLYQ